MGAVTLIVVGIRIPPPRDCTRVATREGAICCCCSLRITKTIQGPGITGGVSPGLSTIPIWIEKDSSQLTY
jgi:hypothetical protein